LLFKFINGMFAFKYRLILKLLNYERQIKQ